VRVGVVGCGHWGPNHVRVFSQLQGSEVTAIADRDESRLGAVGEKYPSARRYADVDELLADPGVDAVVVALPAYLHHPVTMAALAAGKHVLCEKPLAPCPDHAKEMVAAAARANRVLMTGHVFLFNPGILQVAELISRGELGRLFSLRAVRTNLGPIREDVSSVVDLASHDIAICNHLLAATPLRVSAIGGDYLQPGIQDLAFLTLTYPDGVLANIAVSWLDPRKLRELVVVGDRKMVVWDDLSTTGPVRIYDKRVVREPFYGDFGEFRLLAREGDVTVPRVAADEPLKLQNAHFIDCVLNGGTPTPTSEFSVAVVRTLAAALESMKLGGSPVEVRA
jgi:predicted dehydrogenase